MQIGHRFQNLPENPGRILFVVGVAHCVDTLEQIRAPQVLELVHEHACVGRIHVPALDEVRMREIVQQLALLH